MMGAKPVSAAEPARPINVGAPMFVAKIEPAIYNNDDVNYVSSTTSQNVWSMSLVPIYSNEFYMNAVYT